MEQTVVRIRTLEIGIGCRKDGKRNIRGRRAGEGCKTGSGGISCGLV